MVSIRGQGGGVGRVLSEDVSPLPPPVNLGSDFGICAHEDRVCRKPRPAARGPITKEESSLEDQVCRLGLVLGMGGE